MADIQPPPPPEYFMRSVEYIYPTISNISTFFACLIVVTMILFSLYDFKLVNRVSLRLQTIISVIDIWTHTTPHWFPYYYTEQSSMCTFIAWQRMFFPLLYLFYNVAIGANLQLVFIHDITITKKIEIAYWVVPIVAALLITIPPLATGLTGFGSMDRCYFTDQDEKTLAIADMLIMNVWYIITWIYLIIVVGIVVFKLTSHMNQIKLSKKFVSVRDENKALNVMRALTWRLLLYPAVALIVTSGNLATQIHRLLNNAVSWDVDIWAMNSVALTGTLNFIAFACDPTIHNAIYTVYSRIRYGKESTLVVVDFGNENDIQLKETDKELENNGENKEEFLDDVAFGAYTGRYQSL